MSSTAISVSVVDSLAAEAAPADYTQVLCKRNGRFKLPKEVMRKIFETTPPETDGALWPVVPASEFVAEGVTPSATDADVDFYNEILHSTPFPHGYKLLHTRNYQRQIIAGRPTFVTSNKINRAYVTRDFRTFYYLPAYSWIWRESRQAINACRELGLIHDGTFLVHRVEKGARYEIRGWQWGKEELVLLP